MKNKGFATIVILGIILGALVIGGGAYYLGAKKNFEESKTEYILNTGEDEENINNEEIKSDNSNLSNWKDFSFNGNQYLPSLSFSYPSNWKIEYKDNKVSNTNYIKIKSPTGNTEINYFNTAISGKFVDCSYKTDVNGIIKCNMISGLPLQLYYVKDENSLEIYDKVMSSFKVSEIKKETNNELMEITLYFGNEIKNPGSWDCSLVYPVKRMIPKTDAVARASLEELIKGPTKEEKSLGYYGTLPVEVKINSININNGILSIDFSKEIENNFASCSGNYRLTSISKTMSQFSTIKDIKLAVDGNWNRDEILQP